MCLRTRAWWLLLAMLAAWSAHADGLHEAASTGDVARVRQLLAAGADANAAQANGQRPLDEAANAATAAVLLAAGADPRASRADGMTALHWHAIYGRADVVKLLLAHGVTVDAAERSGFTPLLGAAHPGSRQAEVVKLLLAAGARVDRRWQGEVPLHAAARCAGADVVRALLAGGAALDERDAGGATPLALAAWCGQPATVEALLAGGASLEARDLAGETPLDQALGEGRADVVRLLLERGASWLPWQRAAFRGDLDRLAALERLAARGARLDAGDMYGTTPLHRAAGAGDLKIVNWLLAHGARVDPRDAFGATPLHRAATAQQREVARCLLDHQADLQARDAFGQSVLDRTEYRDLDDLLGVARGRFWIGPRWRPARRDFALWSALDRAVFRGDVALVTALLEHGADPFRSWGNCDGSSSLHIACFAGHPGVLRVLAARWGHHDLRDRDGLDPQRYLKAGHHEELAALLQPGWSAP